MCVPNAQPQSWAIPVDHPHRRFKGLRPSQNVLLPGKGHTKMGVVIPCRYVTWSCRMPRPTQEGHTQEARSSLQVGAARL